MQIGIRGWCIVQKMFDMNLILIKVNPKPNRTTRDQRGTWSIYYNLNGNRGGCHEKSTREQATIQRSRGHKQISLGMLGMPRGIKTESKEEELEDNIDEADSKWLLPYGLFIIAMMALRFWSLGVLHPTTPSPGACLSMSPGDFPLNSIDLTHLVNFLLLVYWGCGDFLVPWPTIWLVSFLEEVCCDLWSFA